MDGADTSVTIVGASAVIRAGLASLVEASPGWHVSRQLIDLSTATGLVLLDWHGAAAELIERLSKGRSSVIVLTDEPGLPILKAGARGVLPAAASALEIHAALEAVVSGLLVLHPEQLHNSPVMPVDSILSAREIEVLRMLGEGLANKEIAFRMEISGHTVKFHVASIFAKLHVSSRTEAIRAGLRRGLILL